MDTQDFRSLQEAYMEVYSELDEANRGDEHVTSNMYTSDNDVKTAKKRRRQIRDFKGVLHPDDYGSQGEPVRQKTHAQGRGVKTKGSGMREETDIYDIILSHLLDEGYAETQEAAETIMVNMSEDWAYSIVEAINWDESEPGITAKPIPKRGRRASAAKRHKFEKERRQTSGRYVAGRDPQGGLSPLMLAFRQRAAETGQG